MQKVRKVLIEDYGFKEVKSIPHRLLYLKNGIMIDLLPFEEITDSETMVFKEGERTNISVLGFTEIYRHLLRIGYHKQDFKIATLPSLCILKLIAWDECGIQRQKDIIDISIIIKYYFDLFHEEIFDKHLDLFTENFDTLKCGARLLGRQIKSIIDDNDKLKSKLLDILYANSRDKNNSPLGDILSRQNNQSVDQSISLIIEIISGINESIDSQY
jgi:predicted nucleotidyltransferase